ncbi:MAG TPA: GHKL domain-containing protein [Candidatus Ornithocaccomicrobium faecavium]|uniref:histidine kinase n=1 Tax=Candidatus Ornithocaccomicrobium faecavium TaxID=2840890 RepID=A0A9D1P625_9FIRM|nr:GHKL domain-containing protein [Candidatus Ornithocaccomicrobium faecavium]
MHPRDNDYSQLKRKLLLRLAAATVGAIFGIVAFYILIWQGEGGDFVVLVLQWFLGMDYYEALDVYRQVFRSNAELLWLGAVLVTFFILLRVVLNWFTRYFAFINRGIGDLLEEDSEIRLPPEMAATERKLNAVKGELKRRAREAKVAEQRKNDLVMYLAHDIRTPLTSVIGYLSFLSEAPDMPVEQRAKYVNITLEKAYRLEKMVDEFFEIARYNLQELRLQKEPIDLYYMLVQIIDELTPVLAAHGNHVALQADETLTAYGDPDRLARVFNNVLKNAAAYSFANTQIDLCAKSEDGFVTVTCKNQGKTIPPEKLSAIFERFYRLDESRASNTGGAGLGLAIAQEIVALHGGTIAAASENNTVTFTIVLPLEDKTQNGKEGV